MQSKNYYPVFLDLTDRLCVVGGGGKTAFRKAQGLLAAGARVKVIAPRLCDEMEDLGKTGNLEIVRREYQEKDLREAGLVFAATNNSEVNKKIFEDGSKAGIPVNTVDTPEFCDFLVPALLRRGSLSVAVSTGGVSPFLARSIKQKLEKQIGPEFEEYLRLFGELRNMARQQAKTEQEKEAIYRRFDNPEVLETLKSGQQDKAKEMMLACI